MKRILTTKEIATNADVRKGTIAILRVYNKEVK